MSQWTKPYYGVQHLVINDRRVTVNDYGSGANVYLAPARGSERPFTPVKEQWVSSAEEARRIGEQWLMKLTPAPAQAGEPQ